MMIQGQRNIPTRECDVAFTRHLLLQPTLIVSTLSFFKALRFSFSFSLPLSPSLSLPHASGIAMLL